ncbi:UNKNOWN [Stylonychia lemnae]|uniref:Uncharacterized protein n=1 Tax=Stylonychia lemnae TaxID=5949 RepID=A0A078A061_STYLE|nr:UNKNOWN [Stylonychia lemnae]|eukprot:CDW75535.1 UNKNOWN [Stylonychia lemnae]
MPKKEEKGQQLSMANLSFSKNDLSSQARSYEENKSKSILQRLKDLVSYDRFAWTLISINKNNILPIQLMTAFQIVDYTLLLYTPIIILYSQRANVKIEESWVFEKILAELSLQTIFYVELAGNRNTATSFLDFLAEKINDSKNSYRLKSNKLLGWSSHSSETFIENKLHCFTPHSL